MYGTHMDFYFLWLFSVAIYSDHQCQDIFQLIILNNSNSYMYKLFNSLYKYYFYILFYFIILKSLQLVMDLWLHGFFIFVSTVTFFNRYVIRVGHTNVPHKKLMVWYRLTGQWTAESGPRMIFGCNYISASVFQG